MSLPTTGPYSSFMDSFFGYLDTVEQQALWTSFLEKNSLTTNPADSDLVTQAKFMSFVQSTYTDMQQLSVSPSEAVRRHLMFSVFDIIILLMQKMQVSATEEGGLIRFLGKMQEVYTQMMSRVPIYIGGSANSGHIDWTDPSKFTLGFNDITMQELLQFVLTTGQTAVFDSYLTTNKNAKTGLIVVENGQKTYFTDITGYSISITPNLQSGDIHFELKDRTTTGNGITVPTSWYTVVDGTVDTGLPLDKQVNQAFDILKALRPIMDEKANLPTSAVALDAATNGQYDAAQVQWWINNRRGKLIADNTPYIPQNSQFNLVYNPQSSEDDRVDQNASSQKREQKNSVLQQYIENLRSKRETLRNQSDGVNTILETSKQSIKGSAGILNSIIQQMKNILDSVFK